MARCLHLLLTTSHTLLAKNFAASVLCAFPPQGVESSTSLATAHHAVTACPSAQRTARWTERRLPATASSWATQVRSVSKRHAKNTLQVRASSWAMKGSLLQMKPLAYPSPLSCACDAFLAIEKRKHVATSHCRLRLLHCRRCLLPWAAQQFHRIRPEDKQGYPVAPSCRTHYPPHSASLAHFESPCGRGSSSLPSGI